jgi:hypothetical protein
MSHTSTPPLGLRDLLYVELYLSFIFTFTFTAFIVTAMHLTDKHYKCTHLLDCYYEFVRLECSVGYCIQGLYEGSGGTETLRHNKRLTPRIRVAHEKIEVAELVK